MDQIDRQLNVCSQRSDGAKETRETLRFRFAERTALVGGGVERHKLIDDETDLGEQGGYRAQNVSALATCC